MENLVPFIYRSSPLQWQEVFSEVLAASEWQEGEVGGHKTEEDINEEGHHHDSQKIKKSATASSFSSWSFLIRKLDGLHKILFDVRQLKKTTAAMKEEAGKKTHNDTEEWDEENLSGKNISHKKSSGSSSGLSGVVVPNVDVLLKHCMDYVSNLYYFREGYLPESPKLFEAAANIMGVSRCDKTGKKFDEKSFLDHHQWRKSSKTLEEENEYQPPLRGQHSSYFPEFFLTAGEVKKGEEPGRRFLLSTPASFHSSFSTSSTGEENVCVTDPNALIGYEMAAALCNVAVAFFYDGIGDSSSSASENKTLTFKSAFKKFSTSYELLELAESWLPDEKMYIEEEQVGQKGVHPEEQNSTRKKKKGEEQDEREEEVSQHKQNFRAFIARLKTCLIKPQVLVLKYLFATVSQINADKHDRLSKLALVASNAFAEGLRQEEQELLANATAMKSSIKEGIFSTSNEKNDKKNMMRELIVSFLRNAQRVLLAQSRHHMALHHYHHVLDQELPDIKNAWCFSSSCVEIFREIDFLSTSSTGKKQQQEDVIAEQLKLLLPFSLQWKQESNLLFEKINSENEKVYFVREKILNEAKKNLKDADPTDSAAAILTTSSGLKIPSAEIHNQFQNTSTSSKSTIPSKSKILTFQKQKILKQAKMKKCFDFLSRILIPECKNRIVECQELHEKLLPAPGPIQPIVELMRYLSEASTDEEVEKKKKKNENNNNNILSGILASIKSLHAEKIHQILWFHQQELSPLFMKLTALRSPFLEGVGKQKVKQPRNEQPAMNEKGMDPQITIGGCESFPSFSDENKKIAEEEEEENETTKEFLQQFKETSPQLHEEYIHLQEQCWMREILPELHRWFSEEYQEEVPSSSSADSGKNQPISAATSSSSLRQMRINAAIGKAFSLFFSAPEQEEEEEGKTKKTKTKTTQKNNSSHIFSSSPYFYNCHPEVDGIFLTLEKYRSGLLQDCKEMDQHLHMWMEEEIGKRGTEAFSCASLEMKTQTLAEKLCFLHEIFQKVYSNSEWCRAAISDDSILMKKLKKTTTSTTSSNSHINFTSKNSFGGVLVSLCQKTMENFSALFQFFGKMKRLRDEFEGEIQKLQPSSSSSTGGGKKKGGAILATMLPKSTTNNNNVLEEKEENFVVFMSENDDDEEDEQQKKKKATATKKGISGAKKQPTSSKKPIHQPPPPRVPLKAKGVGSRKTKRKDEDEAVENVEKCKKGQTPGPLGFTTTTTTSHLPAAEDGIGVCRTSSRLSATIDKLLHDDDDDEDNSGSKNKKKQEPKAKRKRYE